MSRRRKTNFLFFLFFIAAAYYLLMNIPGLLKLLYPLEYPGSILKYAVQYEIDPAMVAALIRTESNFRAGAESKKGARGLMQITPPTGEWIAGKLGIEKYSEEELFEPDSNVRMGCWYLRYLMETYNSDYVLVAAAYNGGRGNVDKWLQDENLSSDGKTLEAIPFKETENFVKRVRLNYRIYKQLYDWEKLMKEKID